MLCQPPGVGGQGIEPSHGDHEPALGQRILQRHEGERSAGIPSSGRCLGDHRHAGAERDHAADGVEPAHPHARPYPATCPCRVRSQMPAERAVAGKADELAGQRFRECNSRPARKRMAMGRYEHEAVGTERHHLQPRQIGVVSSDPDLGQRLGDAACDLHARSLVQLHVDVRVRRKEARQRLGQKLRRGGRVREQPDMALQPTGTVSQLAPHPLHLSRQQPCVMRERPASGGRLDATPTALEKRHARLLLHAPHPCAGGGKGETRAGGARRDAPCLDDMQKETQVRQVEMHGSSLRQPAFV